MNTERIYDIDVYCKKKCSDICKYKQSTRSKSTNIALMQYSVSNKSKFRSHGWNIFDQNLQKIFIYKV